MLQITGHDGEPDRRPYRHNKLLVDVFFGNVWLKVRRLQEAQEKLIHQLRREKVHVKLDWLQHESRAHCR